MLSVKVAVNQPIRDSLVEMYGQRADPLPMLKESTEQLLENLGLLAKGDVLPDPATLTDQPA